MITTYRNDETPVCNGTPEVGGFGADRAVAESLECRRHGERFLKWFAVPGHTTNLGIIIN